ncbi:MAG: hypothetical protein HXY34_02730 [Candidatus Thorarchaeota archaeon]|nr:hypothetical protein [Candidatus Thorarchaeota archaeon]
MTQIGSLTFIERFENKYLSMLRKRVLCPGLSVRDRTQAMDDYINALILLERIEDGGLKK